MHQFQVKICENRPIAPNYMHLAFEWPDSFESPRAGQFFTLMPSMIEAGAGMLLRRPLAFAGFEKRSFV
jgi:NAD(P)H-flavin reductase